MLALLALASRAQPDRGDAQQLGGGLDPRGGLVSTRFLGYPLGAGPIA